MTIAGTFPVKEMVIDVKRKVEKKAHSIRELGFSPVKAIPY